MNLLNNSKMVSKWLPWFWFRPFAWKVFSGKWKVDPSHRIVCAGQTKLHTGESIALFGPSGWTDYSFEVTFKIMTDSTKPPEGGVILYSHFKNFQNYYSYHFCLFKNKIEFIKRTRGHWRTIFIQDFVVEIDRSYLVTIDTFADIHQCRINGKKYIELEDKDTNQGCIGIGTKYCRTEFSHVSASIR